MRELVLVLAVIMLVSGLVLSAVSRGLLTETGKTTPWFKRIVPVWRKNEFYVPPGRSVVILASSLMLLGAVLGLLGTFAIK